MAYWLSQVTIAFMVAVFCGNGNGFKLGGNGRGGNSQGTHVVINCLAFNNRKKGFDGNTHTWMVIC